MQKGSIYSVSRLVLTSDLPQETDETEKEDNFPGQREASIIDVRTRGKRAAFDRVGFHLQTQIHTRA